MNTSAKMNLGIGEKMRATQNVWFHACTQQIPAIEKCFAAASVARPRCNFIKIYHNCKTKSCTRACPQTSTLFACLTMCGIDDSLSEAIFDQMPNKLRQLFAFICLSRRESWCKLDLRKIQSLSVRKILKTVNSGSFLSGCCFGVYAR